MLIQSGQNKKSGSIDRLWKESQHASFPPIYNNVVFAIGMIIIQWWSVSQCGWPSTYPSQCFLCWLGYCMDWRALQIIWICQFIITMLVITRQVSTSGQMKNNMGIETTFSLCPEILHCQMFTPTSLNRGGTIHYPVSYCKCPLCTRPE